MEYSPLLDSSNITTDDWVDLERTSSYDGFVILHGTDTMAYTASALSFMCEHLGKPLYSRFTGTRVPIYERRTDGIDNLLGALLIAGQFVIPEVGLYFHHTLYRGNRVTKVDNSSFNAFSSPNLAPLATAEVDISINWDTVWMANTTAKFRVSTELNRNVGLLRLFPDITAATVRAFLQPPMQGVVLETYGSGNAPDNRKDLLEELKKATNSGVIIINCTQCLRGKVSTSYATGKVLIDAGLIGGGDMTSEAALSKLSYVLAKKDLDLEAKKRVCLVCVFVRQGSNLSLEDYDGRTPLHVACCEGNLKAVQYLLSQEATVYAKDRYGATPLANAVHFRHKEVVWLLRKTGAQFSRDELDEAGTELCSLSASGDLESLEIWSLAGADLTKPGYDGQNAIQVAQSVGKNEVVEFLALLMSNTTKVKQIGVVHGSPSS
uniref:asparaginase n=1 Tax=Neogobius melanostomus TaxID=47308 RepID=A0A8C6TJ21_9GOBI